MNIIKSDAELTKVEKYLMTKTPTINAIQGVEDHTVIPVKHWLLFEDGKDSNNSVELLSIITHSNEVYTSKSETFKRSFFDIVEIMEGEPFSIVKLSGTTKSGRAYVDCSLDITNMNG